VALSTRPFLAVYVAWHPGFGSGAAIAKKLHNHFRRDLYGNVAGGAGLSVIYRSAPDPETGAPMSITLEESETTAIVVLIDHRLATDPAYVQWTRDVAGLTEAAGLRARLFLVAIDETGTSLGFTEQAARWDRWAGMEESARLLRLASDLTYQFCRMLRSYLERLRRPDEKDAALEQYLKKVEIFLSHSKHDPDGERIAHAVRRFIFDGDGLASFFDVHDIPAGLRFDAVLLEKVKVSAVVAIHTDSFSSREWCRREIIEAKRWNAPLVIADCISDTDERGFPYLGNVPVVRMDPGKVDRIADVVARLLDEVLKDFLWRCRVESAVAGGGENDVAFMPRAPELIALVGLVDQPGDAVVVVYPDPPLGAEEQRLFEQIAPRFRLRSFTEWVALSGVAA
jgi:hypothetical protein